VEGVTAEWVHGAMRDHTVTAGSRSDGGSGARAGGSLSHSGRVARQVILSVRPGTFDGEGGGETLPASRLLVSVDGGGFRRLGFQAVEIAPAAGGDQSQSVIYRIGNARVRPESGDGRNYSVDVVYTISLIGT
jgi:hypothetical protein